MTMATHVAVLNCGKVEQFGTPEDLVQNPATAFVLSMMAKSRGSSSRFSAACSAYSYSTSTTSSLDHGLQLAVVSRPILRDVDARRFAEPRLLPAATLFPALWAKAPSRFAAGYFLAASRGLPQGAGNFYGASFAAGIALWIAASVLFVATHALLWTAQPGRGRATAMRLSY